MIKKNRQVATSLSEDQYEELIGIAEAQGVKMSQMIRMVLEEYVRSGRNKPLTVLAIVQMNDVIEDTINNYKDAFDRETIVDLRNGMANVIKAERIGD